jgi:hypothetical protein
MIQVRERGFLEIEGLTRGGAQGREKLKTFVQEIAAIHARDYRAARPRTHRNVP